MSLVTLQGVSLTLGAKPLLRDADLRIGESDRLGLIGPNGSGKTTLLKILIGVVDPDDGEVARRRQLRIGYLPQHLELIDGVPLLELVRASIPQRQTLETELAEVQERLASHPEDTEEIVELSGRLADLQARLDHFEQHYGDHVALRILSGLGFDTSDADRNVGELSGGWQMRAQLAALLLSQPELLLLDEPTNHLDLPSVGWFSRFLQRYPRAFVLICHDREFLNDQIQGVVSLEPEGLRSYTGNYDLYLRQREEEEVILQNRARNLERERAKAEEFINRFRAQANKARAVQSRVKALERMDEVETLQSHQQVAFRFPPCTRTSQVVIEAKDLARSYGDHTVLSGVNLSVQRGERIGIIGVNGAGKTTLLRVLAGELDADAGEIQLGYHVDLGFYAQHHSESLDADRTVYEEVHACSRGRTPTEIRTLLGALLFSGDDIDKPVHVLSGGERARVALARLLISPHNLMLMDEPTNHLDLSSTERLADALAIYDGTLLFVSHNLGFIRRVATRIWNVADGDVEAYPGTLDEYIESSLRQLEVPDEGTLRSAAPTPTKRAKGDRVDAKARRRQQAELRARRKEVLGPLEERVQQLETRIMLLETAQAQRNEELADPDFYASPLSAETVKEYQRDAAELESLTAAWEEASTELERAEAELEEEL